MDNPSNPQLPYLPPLPEQEQPFYQLPPVVSSKVNYVGTAGNDQQVDNPLKRTSIRIWASFRNPSYQRRLLLQAPIQLLATGLLLTIATGTLTFLGAFFAAIFGAGSFFPSTYYWIHLLLITPLTGLALYPICAIAYLAHKPASRIIILNLIYFTITNLPMFLSTNPGIEDIRVLVSIITTVPFLITSLLLEIPKLQKKLKLHPATTPQPHQPSAGHKKTIILLTATIILPLIINYSGILALIPLPE